MRKQRLTRAQMRTVRMVLVVVYGIGFVVVTIVVPLLDGVPILQPKFIAFYALLILPGVLYYLWLARPGTKGVGVLVRQT